MGNTRPATYKPRRNTKADAKRQLKRKLRQSNIANGGFTPKVLTVINNYMENGFYQIRAMIDAGYSPNDSRLNQFRIFGRPDVKAEIAKRMKALTDKSEVDSDWLMSKLKLLIEANLGDILRKLEHHGHDLNCLSDEELFVLGDIQIERGMEVIGHNKDGSAVTQPWVKVKIKTEGKNQTIVTALRKLGLFKDDNEQGGKAAGDVIAALMAGRKRASDKTS